MLSINVAVACMKPFMENNQKERESGSYSKLALAASIHRLELLCVLRVSENLEVLLARVSLACSMRVFMLYQLHHCYSSYLYIYFRFPSLQCVCVEWGCNKWYRELKIIGMNTRSQSMETEKRTQETEKRIGEIQTELSPRQVILHIQSHEQRQEAREQIA